MIYDVTLARDMPIALTAQSLLNAFAHVASTLSTADADAAWLPGAMTAALNYYRQLFRPFPGRPTAETTHVQAPTLLIWGEQDPALSIELTYGLEQWVDNLQVKRIAESGHWVQQEQPEKVNQLMLEFLQG